jgi:hypothetical protein
MFGLAFLVVMGFAGLGVALLALAVVAGLVKVIFRVALFPVMLSVGLVKLLVLPIVGLAMLVALAIVGPALLAVLALLAVPVAAIGLVGAVAWGGLRLMAAV